MGGKKGRQVAGKTIGSDFTINDFANASAAVAKSGRMKKGENKVCTPDQGKALVEPSKDDLAWYEKDLSDFEILDEETAVSLDQQGEKGEKEEGAVGGSTSTRRRRRHRSAPHSPRTDSCSSESGVDYPLDLWFVLGLYIAPEDVSTFARLCRDSHYVAHSTRFWLNMYKRFYVPAPDLPSLLQPHAISHIHGLRTRVVRSLFYMYPPFLQRRLAVTPLSQDPDVLAGARCVLMWHKKVKTTWQFYFKFLLPDLTSSANNNNNRNHQGCCLSKKSEIASEEGHFEDDLLADLDVYANSEENCCVLRVVSKNFISLPVVMGQVLTKTFVSVGHQMQFHKLKLLFDAQYDSRQRLVVSGNAIVLDPVLNIFIMRWWDPKYPYNTT